MEIIFDPFSVAQVPVLTISSGPENSIDVGVGEWYQGLTFIYKLEIWLGKPIEPINLKVHFIWSLSTDFC